MISKSPKIFIIAVLSMFWVNISIAISKEDCVNFEASITQKINHKGFHRDINWLIETQSPDKKTWADSSCIAAVKLEVPKGMYVNPDQADDLRRLGKLDILIDGTVDIEAITHEATKHSVYIYLNNSQISEKVSIKLPIHLRYHTAFMGGHAKVTLDQPSLLVYCPLNDMQFCRYSRVKAPASTKDSKTLKVWKNVSYKADFEKTELLVPVGDLEHYPFVATLSSILGCGGCIYILSIAKRLPD